MKIYMIISVVCRNKKQFPFGINIGILILIQTYKRKKINSPIGLILQQSTPAPVDTIITYLLPEIKHRSISCAYLDK